MFSKKKKLSFIYDPEKDTIECVGGEGFPILAFIAGLLRIMETNPAILSFLWYAKDTKDKIN
ncbi:MAG: hypothetical protein NC124_02075 [Clostridium sp.]|nr:hypothetical protein [Clostridium sp.]